MLVEEDKNKQYWNIQKQVSQHWNITVATIGRDNCFLFCEGAHGAVARATGGGLPPRVQTLGAASN